MLQTDLSGSPDQIAVEETRLLTVNTVPLVRESEFGLRRRFTGQIVAARTSELSFQLAGRLDTLLFDEGQAVQESDELAKLDIQLEDSILVAPYSGTLSARLLDQGAVVSAGQPVFRIVEDQSLEFHVG